MNIVLQKRYSCHTGLFQMSDGSITGLSVPMKNSSA
jgi:hypothetical protein